MNQILYVPVLCLAIVATAGVLVTELLLLRAVHARGRLLLLGLCLMTAPVGTALLALAWLRSPVVSRIARWNLLAFAIAVLAESWLTTWPWF